MISFAFGVIVKTVLGAFGDDFHVLLFFACLEHSGMISFPQFGKNVGMWMVGAFGVGRRYRKPAPGRGGVVPRSRAH